MKTLKALINRNQRLINIVYETTTLITAMAVLIVLVKIFG